MPGKLPHALMMSAPRPGTSQRMQGLTFQVQTWRVGHAHTLPSAVGRNAEQKDSNRESADDLQLDDQQ